MSYITDFFALMSEWLIQHLPAIVGLLIAGFVIKFVAGFFLERIIRRLVPRSHFHSEKAEQQREDTLIRIIRGTLNVVLWVLVALMILSEVGVDIGPLLAAAGVAGLAIGFGGQYLIRDVVAGLFIILENQYRVGDIICLDGTCGTVEDISIRMVTLRDLDGTVHHFPHGVVSKTSNMTKEFARVNLDVGVAYESDLESVIRVIDETGATLAADPAWKEDVIKAPKFERVNDFADSSIVIKILGETKPLRQWAVTGELRKRLKIAFDRAGIQIPYPQRVVHTTP